MKIIFKKLKLYNFMSFKEATIDLDKTGYFLIKGINNNINDLAESNGSGKSTLFESLCWVLTGETVRGTKNVSNIFSNEGACVELTFSVDADDYKIIRKKDPSNLFLFVNDENKSGKGIRDTEKIIEQYLPDLSSSLIGSVILLGQGMPQRFTNNSPSGRKELLEKLSKSDFMVCDLKEKVSNRKNFLTDEIRRLEDELLILNNNKQNIEKSILEIKNKISDLQSSEEMQLVLNNLISEKELKEEAFIDAQKNYDTIKASIKESQEKLDYLNPKIDKIDTDIENKFWYVIEDIRNRLTSAEAKVEFAKQELKKAKSVKDVCPTCGQKLVGVEKPDISIFEDKLSKEISERDIIKTELDNKREELKNTLSEALSDLQNQKNQYKENIRNNKILEEKYEKLVNRLSPPLQNLVTKIAVMEKTIENRDILFNQYTEELNKNKNKLIEINNSLLYNNNEKDILTDRLNIINKIFSALNKEFRGYLLTNIIQYINKTAKEYCKQVFDNDNLNFELDGNNISISYFGKEYENLSGGEKQKVDVIIQFAIRKMLSKYLNFSCNLLVLDEITDFLDKQGVESILNLISENLKDTPAIYFITHHEDLSFPYDGEITVIKNSDGISVLVQK